MNRIYQVFESWENIHFVKSSQADRNRIYIKNSDWIPSYCWFLDLKSKIAHCAQSRVRADKTSVWSTKVQYFHFSYLIVYCPLLVQDCLTWINNKQLRETRWTDDKNVEGASLISTRLTALIMVDAMKHATKNAICEMWMEAGNCQLI